MNKKIKIHKKRDVALGGRATFIIFVGGGRERVFNLSSQVRLLQVVAKMLQRT